MIMAFLCAVSANLDMVGVSISYGIKRMKIGLAAAFAVSLTGGLFTFLAMTAGRALSGLDGHLANLLGALALAILGLFYVVKAFSDHKETLLTHPEKADADHSGRIDTKESLLLGLALSVNNVGVGFTAGAAGLAVGWTVLFTFLINLAAIPLGARLGNTCLSRFLGKYAELASGLVIFLIGMVQVFTA